MTDVRSGERRLAPRNGTGAVPAAHHQPSLPQPQQALRAHAPVVASLRVLDNLEATYLDLLVKCQRHLDKHPALADEVARHQAEQSNIALNIAAGAQPSRLAHTELSQVAKEFVEHRTLCENELLECANVRAMIGRMDERSLAPLMAKHLEHRRAIAQIRQECPDAQREVLAYAFAHLQQANAPAGKAMPLPVLSPQAQELVAHMELAKEVSREYAGIQTYLWHKADGAIAERPGEVKIP
jgi:hypothetical protein